MVPVIWWIRRDLRLADNPALVAALAGGQPVIPLFIHDECSETLGAAAKWRLGLGLAHLGQVLAARGSRLILRRGAALATLQAVVAETGAGSVQWGRLHDPAARLRDTAVKAALKAGGTVAESHPGHVLHEPWTVATGAGGPYRVFTPFWSAVRGREVALPLPAPAFLPPPSHWPATDRLDDWQMGAAMQRGAAVVVTHQRIGEVAAMDRLTEFLDRKIGRYAAMRDFPGVDATSHLSENLTCGEIGPRQIWHAGFGAMARGDAGAETFLKELVWRDFACHLIHHWPDLASKPWKPEWAAFPWQGDNPAAMRWKQGRTGVQLVDAAMRELAVTGTIHNRARMVAASYLTKHLMTDWRVGLAWFADWLTDWDPASNAMGWQWVAGCGPDAAPYFRIFNPDGQAAKFDGDARYRHRFIAELSTAPGQDALAFYDAVPRGWALRPDDAYPAPVVGLAEGRERALAAYGSTDWRSAAPA